MEFVCFVWISEQTANFALHNNKILVFITDVESVYSAVRTESSYNTDNFRIWKVKLIVPYAARGVFAESNILGFQIVQ